MSRSSRRGCDWVDYLLPGWDEYYEITDDCRHRGRLPTIAFVNVIVNHQHFTTSTHEATRYHLNHTFTALLSCHPQCRRSSCATATPTVAEFLFGGSCGELQSRRCRALWCSWYDCSPTRQWPGGVGGLWCSVYWWNSVRWTFAWEQRSYYQIFSSTGATSVCLFLFLLSITNGNKYETK